MMLKTDFLVVGSGIAGLSYALKVAKTLPDRTISVICKDQPKETNTRYAQGGIAVVSDFNSDSIEAHIQDTLKAGAGLCDKKVVELVITEGPKRLAELIDNGVSFDKINANCYDLAREGGHTHNRIFHKGDFTGLEIEKKLLAQVRKTANIRILENTSAIDLITDRFLNKRDEKDEVSTCFGVSALKANGEVINIYSKVTFLATGGIGQIFDHTTNSPVATGDGIAIASRAGAAIKHMEFIQFHPTALYDPDNTSSFLISEAVRGSGAVLKTPDGIAFMKDYDPRKDLATRDIVSRAIDSELRKHNTPFVYLDCTRISKKEFLKHFPTITTKCINMGINPSYKMIPVSPAAHYSCGGIKTDISGKTNIKNLYAVGECACTGLHGANRLASNSLLEALVFSHQAYLDSVKTINFIPGCDPTKFTLPRHTVTKTTFSKDVSRLKSTMSRAYGITTSTKRLREGMKMVLELEKIYRFPEKYEISLHLLELRNMIESALLILKSALNRTVNRGVFYNVDLCHEYKKRLLRDNNLQKT